MSVVFASRRPSRAPNTGAVPAHWRDVRLKSIAEVLPSNVDKKAVEGETPVLLCNYTDVYYNDRIVAGMSFMEATASLSQVARLSLKAGDVVITKDSETADDIARAAFVPDTLHGVVCGYHLAIVRPSVHADGAFLRYWFEAKSTRAAVEVLSNGLTRVALGVGDIASLRLDLPPLPEQRAIAGFLDRETAKIDASIRELVSLADLVKEGAEAFLLHAIARGVDGDPVCAEELHGWISGVQSRWQVVPIRRVARLESGHTPSRSVSAYWEDCTIPWFTLADVWQIRDARMTVVEETAELVSEIGIANSSARVLPAGTVMLSRTASVGFSAIMGVPMATSQDFANWICGPEILPDYLLWALRAMRPEFRRLMMGSTHNTIYMPDIRALRCPLPSIDEQRRIVEAIASNANRSTALSGEARRAIDLLKERRDALITAAVTGQIDVREMAEPTAA